MAKRLREGRLPVGQEKIWPFFGSIGPEGVEESPTIFADRPPADRRCGDLAGRVRQRFAERLAQASKSAKSSLWSV